MLDRIRELTIKEKEIKKELDMLKNMVLVEFDNMSDEDMALSEGVMRGKGIEINYFPASTYKRVDSKKLKEDGIYDNYTSESKRRSYIRVNTYETE